MCEVHVLDSHEGSAALLLSSVFADDIVVKAYAEEEAEVLAVFRQDDDDDKQPNLHWNLSSLDTTTIMLNVEIGSGNTY